MGLVQAAEALRDDVEALDFSDRVPYVYDPLVYAWDPHRKYLQKYGKATKRAAILVGMNPGPWGMGQTGVPFGDVTKVRDWLGITGKVDAPGRTHPKRPVQGFETRRREPSGTRLWSWAQERYGTPERFFARYFVLNYCPLLFFSEDGKNLTPPDLRKADTEALYEACDAHVVKAARALKPEWLVGIGGFAEKRLLEIVEAHGLDAQVGSVLHPSPANPRANRGWAEQAQAQLEALGVEPIGKKGG